MRLSEYGKVKVYDDCPYCGQSTLLCNGNEAFEVKTRRKSVSFVHYACYEKNKRGATCPEKRK